MTGAAARPRVVHMVPALFGPGGLVGGAERYVFELARHMAERVDTRLHIRVGNGSANPIDEARGESRCVRIGIDQQQAWPA